MHPLVIKECIIFLFYSFVRTSFLVLDPTGSGVLILSQLIGSRNDRSKSKQKNGLSEMIVVWRILPNWLFISSRSKNNDSKKEFKWPWVMQFTSDGLVLPWQSQSPFFYSLDAADQVKMRKNTMNTPQHIPCHTNLGNDSLIFIHSPNARILIESQNVTSKASHMKGPSR